MKKVFIFIIFLLNIAAVSATVYFLLPHNGNTRSDNLQEKTVAQKVEASDNTDASEINSLDQEYELKENSPEYNPIIICYRKDCIRTSGNTVSWLKEDSERTGVRIEGYIQSTVKPYFESRYLNKAVSSNINGSYKYIDREIIPDLNNLETKLFDKVRQSEPEGSVLGIELKEIEVAGTDGKYAPQYIEVDNSRQKLYAWSNGKVEKIIKLSGPKAGYEVYGVFPITHKGVSPISPGGLYMPYWMSFYYSPSQKSRYGLHGLVWWYDKENNKVFEQTDNIGIRRSAGCIRMVLSDAKYLYEHYKVGDKVLIHE